MPPLKLWKDSGKAPPGPNELQRRYFINYMPPEERPHKHLQDQLLSIGGRTSGKTFGMCICQIQAGLDNPGINIYLGSVDFQVLKRNCWSVFQDVFTKPGEAPWSHEACIKGFSDQAPVLKMANGTTVTSINLKECNKKNIGFNTGFLGIDELHLIEDESAYLSLLGAVRTNPPEIRQIVMCTNPEKTRQGWVNYTFELEKFDGMDSSEHPIELLVGKKCQCQFCIKCLHQRKKEIEWVRCTRTNIINPKNNQYFCEPDLSGEDYYCPNCGALKDFCTWKGKKYHCPGQQQYTRVIKSESFHNPHAPDDVFQGMADAYDKKFFAVMVKGEVNQDLREGFAYPKYIKEVNKLKEEIPLDYSKDIYWTLDFNFIPMCSSIHQWEDITTIIDGEDDITEQNLICKQEMVMYGPTRQNPYGGCTALDMTMQFAEDHPLAAELKTNIYIYGDPKGFDGQTERELTKYAKIVNYLEDQGFNVHLMMQAPAKGIRTQIPRKERLDNTDDVLEKGILKINPSCVHVLKSFEELKIKEGSLKYELDDSGDKNASRSVNRSRVYCMTHPTDGIGYMVYKLCPILENLSGVRSAHMAGGTIIQETNKGEVVVTNSNVKQERPKYDPNRSTASQINNIYKDLERQVEEDIKKEQNQTMRGLLNNVGISLY